MQTVICGRVVRGVIIEFLQTKETYTNKVVKVSQICKKGGKENLFGQYLDTKFNFSLKLRESAIFCWRKQKKTQNICNCLNSEKNFWISSSEKTTTKKERKGFSGYLNSLDTEKFLLELYIWLVKAINIYSFPKNRHRVEEEEKGENYVKFNCVSSPYKGWFNGFSAGVVLNFCGEQKDIYIYIYIKVK